MGLHFPQGGKIRESREEKEKEAGSENSNKKNSFERARLSGEKKGRPQGKKGMKNGKIWGTAGKRL